MSSQTFRSLVDQSQPFSRRYLVGFLRLDIRGGSFTLALFGTFAGAALLLSLVGIYGVLSFVTSQRTQEIGVRMALGAQRGEILRMVLRHGMVLIAAGICIGVLASFGLTRFLKSQIWGVSATDPWTFGAVAALVVITGLAACLLPARRAASVDPLVGLRYE